MTKKYPIGDWSFDGDFETQFQEWFNNLYGEYSLRSEAFYTDCLIGDEKTRQELMYRWIYAAFYCGYECALYSKLEEEQRDT